MNNTGYLPLRSWVHELIVVQFNTLSKTHNHIPSEHWYTFMLVAPVCLYTRQRCECECEKASYAFLESQKSAIKEL